MRTHMQKYEDKRHVLHDEDTYIVVQAHIYSSTRTHIQQYKDRRHVLATLPQPAQQVIYLTVSSVRTHAHTYILVRRHIYTSARTHIYQCEGTYILVRGLICSTRTRRQQYEATYMASQRYSQSSGHDTLDLLLLVVILFYFVLSQQQGYRLNNKGIVVCSKYEARIPATHRIVGAKPVVYTSYTSEGPSARRKLDACAKKKKSWR